MMSAALHRRTGLGGLALLLVSAGALGHTIAGSNAVFVQGIDGPAIAAFLYLGAKHMVTGYDHLLFLCGVLFYLARPLQVLHYVSLFALGHSLTLLAGVLLNLPVNAALIDAIIGFSVVYKAFENLGGFHRPGLRAPAPHTVVFVFGLIHGLGLATRLQDFEMSANGLLANLLAFNVGVEIGQMLALTVIFLLLSVWRRRDSFQRQARAANTLLLGAGLLLTFWQLSLWLLGSPL
jgi:hypothetical protein